MRVELEDIVPWGRSFDEYLCMFALREADLAKRILGCADGPAAFNAGMAARGATVVSVDPLYRFSVGQIRERITKTRAVILEQVRRNLAGFVWDRFESPEHLGRVRMAAMEEFLSDFPAGCSEGRYREARLPCLPFSENSFELALCSHFLFLYGDRLDVGFHLEAIFELLRVSEEVRVFPLLDLAGARSAHLAPVMDTLRSEGFGIGVERVPYELQRGGNEMLRITRPLASSPTP